MIDDEMRGFVRTASGIFQSDRSAEQLSDADLRAVAATPGQALTYTAVPPGSGVRIGVDRDEDGYFDRDEIDAGSDAADAASVPSAVEAFVTVQTTTLVVRDATTPPDPSKRKLSFVSSTRKDPSGHRVVPPLPGSGGDLTLHGAVLVLYNSAGSGEQVTIPLPAQGWKKSTRVPATYTYSDKAGPILRTVVRMDRIQVQGGKAGFAYTLDEPQQGRLALRIQLGSDVVYCTDAAAKATGNPPDTARNDHVDLFRAQPRSSLPESCPPPS